MRLCKVPRVGNKAFRLSGNEPLRLLKVKFSPVTNPGTRPQPQVIRVGLRRGDGLVREVHAAGVRGMLHMR